MFEQRLKRLKELMRASGSECLILMPGADLFYVSGIMAHPSERLIAAIVPLEREETIICPSFEKGRIQESSRFNNILTWEEDQDPFKLLGATIKELELEEKQIALDNKLWFSWFLKITQELPKGNFVDSNAITRAARIVKSEEEIAIMRKATKIAAEAIYSAFNEAAPGMTETDIYQIVQKGLRKDGAIPAFALVQSGPNSSMPHGAPTGRTIEKNDVLLIDAGPIFEGYVGDITMTSVVGEPNEKFMKIYDVVYRANRAAFNIAKEGVIAEDLDKIAREVITKEGFGKYFTHRLGHGLGIEGHEHPYIVKGNKQELKERMCHTIEPGIYLEGEFGVRIEDDVVIRKDGCEFLYEPPRRIWE